jgi:hypothetical protein
MKRRSSIDTLISYQCRNCAAPVIEQVLDGPIAAIIGTPAGGEYRYYLAGISIETRRGDRVSIPTAGDQSDKIWTPPWRVFASAPFCAQKTFQKGVKHLIFHLI